MVFGCSIFSLLANKFGVKAILILGTLGYAPYSASLYVNNRYGTEWFVLFGGATCGIAASALWASEGAIALGYGTVRDRGRFSEYSPSCPPSRRASICPPAEDITDNLDQLGSGLVFENWASSSVRRSSCR